MQCFSGLNVKTVQCPNMWTFISEKPQYLLGTCEYKYIEREIEKEKNYIKQIGCIMMGYINIYPSPGNNRECKKEHSLHISLRGQRTSAPERQRGCEDRMTYAGRH